MGPDERVRNGTRSQAGKRRGANQDMNQGRKHLYGCLRGEDHAKRACLGGPPPILGPASCSR